MFGQSNWKNEFSHRLDQLEQLVADLQRSQTELRTQNHRLAQSLKTISKKLVLRLPISLASLDKGLNYDLIFAEEIESWVSMARDGILLDLRPNEDFQKEHIEGSVNIPMDQLAKRIESMSRQQAFLLICENGVRSVSACELLSSKGFQFLYVLKGGMAHFHGQTTASIAEPTASPSELSAR